MHRLRPALANESSHRNKYSKAKNKKFTTMMRCRLLSKCKQRYWEPKSYVTAGGSPTTEVEWGEISIAISTLLCSLKNKPY